MKRVIFEFPNDDVAEDFLAWFSVQGENKFMVGETAEIIKENGGTQRKPLSGFDYKRAFVAWGYDPAKHGSDFVVEAQESKEEEKSG